MVRLKSYRVGFLGYVRLACPAGMGDGMFGVRYPKHVATNGTSDTRDDTAALLAAVGIEVTDAGKARARRRLADADRQRTPRLRQEWRAQLGLPTSNAA
ncbi:hypothetical protein [Catellatospora sp. NPDC049609]|uniref:hypothetical protein n=1 Tax=Catellatospora sp. NPDC049609 TaxID=3155505 RepID=UPI00341207E8